MPRPAWGVQPGTLTQWGFVTGVVASVLLGLTWTGGGAGIVLFIPIFALVLGPIGWLIGRRTARAMRRRGPR
ncbi:MAG: hypothetical protein WEB13_04715 [Dehalococcoidia bacterium]